VVRAEKVFEVSRLALVDGTARVHALYDGGHVAEHERVHQRCTAVNHATLPTAESSLPAAAAASSPSDSS